jgi:hypothetical protein
MSTCGIKGCTFKAYKGRVCRKHYKLVPQRVVMETTWLSKEAEAKEARRQHRKYLGIVRARLSATGGTEAS